ncbi:MAG: undecaprenyldiphospho-muramoylpentapeptide beta-N-acetylglucosaminyltransferase [Christensenellales bacterium]
MKTIVLTGGGTAGHVTPHLALLPSLKAEGYEVHYIGSKQSIEQELIGSDAIFHPISCGKLRRYFSLQNFTDPFKVISGIFKSMGYLGKIQPDVVFSKGGFVSVPVCLACWFKRIPVVLHESDITPGLANRISFPAAKAICYTFPETLSHLNRKKAVLTGTPIRRELFEGDRQKGRELCGFTDDKPVLLIMGGSQGAVVINQAVRQVLDELLNKYNMIHIAGKNNLDDSLKSKNGYVQFEYVKEELPHLFAACDMVISRAGANSIFELLAIHKPSLLIPLPLSASRGDQIHNAASFEKQNYCVVLPQEEISKLVEKVAELSARKEELVTAMKSSPMQDGTNNVLRVIATHSKIKRA